MLSLFSDLKSRFSVVSRKVRFDSYVNKLHYKFTSGIILLFCVVVTAKEFIGEPIQCITEKGIGDQNQYAKSVNTYCWISSTYTLEEHYDKPVGKLIPHPGVGPENLKEPFTKNYHAYYQWVPFVLLLQSILFYIPHYIWRGIESKSLAKVLDELDGSSFGESEKKFARMSNVVKYVDKSRGTHYSFYLWFLVCEALNFAVVVGNIFFTDTFLGGEFKTFGTEVIDFIQLDYKNRTDPMIKIFPRVTKCDWRMYGPTGTVQKHDAICVLAINIFNEKIYVFLWFWFVILAAITGVCLLYRIIQILLPYMRNRTLKNLVATRDTANPFSDCDYLVRKLSIPDWFVLTGIGEHMDPIYYPDLIKELAKVIKKAPTNQQNHSH